MDPNKPTFSFGNLPKSDKPGLFGSSPASASSQPAGSSIFGSAGNANTDGSSIFGGASSSTGGGFSFGSASSSSATPTTTTSAPSQGGLFGTSSAGNVLGGASTSTPASKPGGLFSFASTTPAATPPAGNTSQPGGQKSLFGSLGGATPAASSAPSLFGSNAASTPKPSLFASTPAVPASAAPAASAAPSLSITAPQSSTPSSTLAAGAAASGTPAAAPPKSMFPSTGSTPASNPPASGGLFSLGAKPAASTTATTTASGAAPSLFSMSNATPSATPATSSAPAPSLFGSTPASSSAAPATTAPTAGSGLGLFGKPAPAAAGPASSSTAAAPSLFGTAGNTTTAANAPAASTNAPALGASTNDLSAPAAARLKNKSMDEILTRWTTDISKYQKEFQKHAAQVAEWDRLLVDNTDKIGKLVTKTFAAERDATEVERQLKSVEDQQLELAQFLDGAEQKVDEQIKKFGLDHDAGVDVERERTYKLAEKLTDRLDELNTDLKDVIVEVNEVSSTLNDTGGPDDPLSRVVRILNQHLSQLQKIDTDSAALQKKVSEAQQQAKSLGSNGWLENDPSQDFYRSLMRR